MSENTVKIWWEIRFLQQFSRTKLLHFLKKNVFFWKANFRKNWHKQMENTHKEMTL